MALPEEYHRGSSAWAWARSSFGVMSLVDSSVKVPYEWPTNWTGSPVLAAGGPQCKSVSAIAVHLPQFILPHHLPGNGDSNAVRLVTERGIGNVC
jgi:hypothetical protein